jgi:hypothetical protein
MRARDEIRKLFAKVADIIAPPRRLSRFTCGDCDQNDLCGLPPDDNCIVKASQIGRAGVYRARPPARYYSAFRPR